MFMFMFYLNVLLSYLQFADKFNCRFVWMLPTESMKYAQLLSILVFDGPNNCLNQSLKQEVASRLF